MCIGSSRSSGTTQLDLHVQYVYSVCFLCMCLVEKATCHISHWRTYGEFATHQPFIDNIHLKYLAKLIVYIKINDLDLATCALKYIISRIK